MLIDLDGRDIWRIENGRLNLIQETEDNYNVFQNSDGMEIVRTNQMMELENLDQPSPKSIADYKEITKEISKSVYIQNKIRERAEETGWDDTMFCTADDFVNSRLDLEKYQQIADFIEIGLDGALMILAPGGVPIYDDLSIMEQGNEALNEGESITETITRNLNDVVSSSNAFWQEVKSSTVQFINNFENAVKNGQIPIM